MAAKRKSSAKSTVQRAAKRAVSKAANKVSRRIFWNFGVTVPVFLILILFAAAFSYGVYLEKGEKDEPIQVITNFIEKDADFAVHYIDVGQGDCSLIVYDDKAILVDAGEKEQGERVVAYINSLGIKKLDYVIATHPHSDHMGGLPQVINAFEVGTVIAPKISEEMTPTTKTYENFLKALSQKGLKLTAARVGDSYSIANELLENDNTAFEILAPVGNAYDDLNDWSVVFRIVHGENSFLFTGDAEKKSENDILEIGSDITADVLKVGHHGSSSSTKKDFLEAISPSIAVIQCGKDNSYNHPNDETLKRLEEHSISIYRNDKSGTIIVYSDGTDIKVTTANDESQEAA